MKQDKIFIRAGIVVVLIGLLLVGFSIFLVLFGVATVKVGRIVST